MPYAFKLYNRDYWIVFPFLMSVVLAAVGFTYIAMRLGPTTDQVFLHYNIIFGIDLSVEGTAWWKMYLFPGIGALLVAVNYLLAWLLYARDQLLARLLAVATPLFEIFLTIGIFLITSLNS
ncbi:MAG TPA: hypothetical protein VJA27_01865 [Patescibacteria group bacterium]|nr:hypothetical protein [Patescibacteria group bacterium]